MRRFFLSLLMVSVLPLTACSGKGPAAFSFISPTEMEGTTWQAVSIYGKPVEIFSDQDVPHILFFEVTPADYPADYPAELKRADLPVSTARVAGSDGCNRLIGSVRFIGNSQMFAPMGATMMACPFGAEQSEAFKKALADSTARHMRDGNLEFLGGDSPVLVFKPVATK